MIHVTYVCMSISYTSTYAYTQYTSSKFPQIQTQMGWVEWDHKDFNKRKLLAAMEMRKSIKIVKKTFWSSIHLVPPSKWLVRGLPLIMRIEEELKNLYWNFFKSFWPYMSKLPPLCVIVYFLHYKNHSPIEEIPYGKAHRIDGIAGILLKLCHRQ